MLAKSGTPTYPITSHTDPHLNSPKYLAPDWDKKCTTPHIPKRGIGGAVPTGSLPLQCKHQPKNRL